MLNRSTLISGIITDESNKCVSQAVIQVLQIDKNLNITTDLGYTLSDINGNYKFIIESDVNMFYEFIVFPPLEI